jgi:hypothetical protein
MRVKQGEAKEDDDDDDGDRQRKERNDGEVNNTAKIIQERTRRERESRKALCSANFSNSSLYKSVRVEA